MFGHYPKVLKSINICTLANKLRLKATFLAMDLTVNWKRGSRYVGGHVVSIAMCSRYTEPKVADWVHAMEALARITVKYP